MAYTIWHRRTNISCKAFLTWGKIWGHLCRGEDRHKSKKPYTNTLWVGIPGRLIPVNLYQPTINLCLLPATEDALRSHHECCLPVSQRCHIDFHVSSNNGLWICFSIFLVTWPRCDVAIPWAFAPRKPICEDCPFMKSIPPKLISTIWAHKGKASPEGEYFRPAARRRRGLGRRAARVGVAPAVAELRPTWPRPAPRPWPWPPP